MDWSEVGNGTLYENDRNAYDREVDRLFIEEGKIVIEGGGYMALGNTGTYAKEEWMQPPFATYPYIESGRLFPDSRINAALPLHLDREVQSIMPVENVEFPYGEGVMRLRRLTFLRQGFLLKLHLPFLISKPL